MIITNTFQGHIWLRSVFLRPPEAKWYISAGKPPPSFLWWAIMTNILFFKTSYSSNLPPPSSSYHSQPSSEHAYSLRADQSTGEYNMSPPPISQQPSSEFTDRLANRYDYQVSQILFSLVSDANKHTSSTLTRKELPARWFLCLEDSQLSQQVATLIQ